MPHIEFKVTVWQRVEVPEDADMDKIKELVKAGDPHGINNYFQEHCEGDYPEWEYLDGETYMTVEENKGVATIELADDRKTIATNAK